MPPTQLPPPRPPASTSPWPRRPDRRITADVFDTRRRQLRLLRLVSCAHPRDSSHGRPAEPRGTAASSPFRWRSRLREPGPAAAAHAAAAACTRHYPPEQQPHPDRHQLAHVGQPHEPDQRPAWLRPPSRRPRAQQAGAICWRTGPAGHRGRVASDLRDDWPCPERQDYSRQDCKFSFCKITLRTCCITLDSWPGLSCKCCNIHVPLTANSSTPRASTTVSSSMMTLAPPSVVWPPSTAAASTTT